MSQVMSQVMGQGMSQVRGRITGRGRRRAFKIVLFLGCLVPLGLLLGGLFDGSLGPNPVEALNRNLGDWALRFLLITLCLRPLAEITGRKSLVAYRRMLGLFAFFYALLHMSNYVIIDLQLDLAAFIEDVLKRNFITIGVVSFVALLLLAATSTKGMIRRLGARNWRRLHWLIYPVSLLGVLHFYMMVRADFREPLLYGAIAAAALAYRVIAARRRVGA